MDLELLKVFVAVADAGSFSRAASALALPRSSVSRAVAQLEGRMKVRLLHRTTRHVALSTAGAALHARVAPLVGALQQALADVPELEEQPSGHLRITATPDIGSGLLAELVARFSERHPQVQVEMRLTVDVVDLVAEGFDLALRVTARPLKDSGMSARNLGPVVLPLYASPNYVARAGTPRLPADLHDHRMVLFRRAPMRLHAGTESAVVTPRVSTLCNDMHVIREAVSQGAGIGLVPPFMAEPHVVSGRLVRVLPRWALKAGTLWLVSPTTQHLPRKVTAFRDFVVDALRGRTMFSAG